MHKLTAKVVEHSLPKQKEYKLADGGGLYLRVRSSGAKSWLFCFRLPGQRQLIPMTIGTIQDFSLKEARLKLIELRKCVAEGIDPRHARAANKAINAQAITMQKLLNSWIEFIRLTNKMSAAWMKKHENRWRLHLKKPLGSILAKDINRSHLAAALDAMARKGIKEETRKALTTLNLMLDYALTRHYIGHNPARLLKPKDFAATANKPRQRALNLSELKKLWVVLDQFIKPQNFKMPTPLFIATAIKILILTGARRSEVVAMRWSELDLKKATWSLPSARTKNGNAHVIFLSNYAIKLIQALSGFSNSPFVFSSHASLYRDIHIHQDTLTATLHKLQNRQLPDLEPFTIHDLRRSAATAWGEYLKAKPHVIERMLNHQPMNKLIATYQRAIYAEEQKITWLAWGELVENQIANNFENVVLINEAVNY